MENTDERLEKILDSIEHQYCVLLEEYATIKEQIIEIQGTGKDTSALVQQLKDNLSSRKALYDKVRQTYKDALNVR